MVMNMKVNGIKDKDMEREYKHENVELFVKEYGNMINQYQTLNVSTKMERKW